jgi:hypothetical protein
VLIKAVELAQDRALTKSENRRPLDAQPACFPLAVRRKPSGK